MSLDLAKVKEFLIRRMSLPQCSGFNKRGIERKLSWSCGGLNCWFSPMEKFGSLGGVLERGLVELQNRIDLKRILLVFRIFAYPASYIFSTYFTQNFYVHTDI